MSTTFYLIRHGQSMGNLRREFLGHTDLDLSPLGYEQAEKVEGYLENTPFDAIYSSDLLRAYHTISHLAAARGQKITTSTDFREIYAGKWEGQPFSRLEADFGEGYLTFRQNIGEACPEDGESTWQVGKRVYAKMEALAHAHEGQAVLISTHATAICMFVCEVLGLAKEERRRVALPTNASLTIVTYASGRFVLKSYSQDAYLGEKKTPTPPLA